jgi:hypothetical protein
MSRFARWISFLLEKRVLLAGAVLTSTLSMSPEAMAQGKKRGITGGDDATAGEQSEGIASGGLSQPGESDSKQGPAPVPSFKMVPRKFKDALVQAPADLVKGAPFNTKNYFEIPDEKANAGPLVLDALTEFPEVYAMVMQGVESKEAFEAGLKERQDRLKTAFEWVLANPNPRQWDANAIEKAVGPYRVLFAKLHEAHKLSDCVIPTGIGSPLPHVQSSAYVAQLAGPLVYADLARGDKKGAIAKFGDVLRLGIDLQPRAVSVTGQVVIFLHKTTLQSTLPILLNSRLNQKDCDEILTQLKNYRDTTISLLPEMLKSEYLVQLVKFQKLSNPGAFKAMMSQLPESASPLKGADLDAADALISALFSAENVEKVRLGLAKSLKEQLAAIDNVGSIDDLAALGQTINQSNQKTVKDVLGAMLTKETMANIAARTGGSGKIDHNTLMTTLEGQVSITRINFSQIVDEIEQFQTNQSLMESLAATRRWYVTKKTTPKGKTLEEVAKEAKLEGAPLDTFSGKPLKMIWTGNGPAIYSVGPDRKDDQGKLLFGKVGEDKKPSLTGDLIVTLALGADPLAPAQEAAAGPGGPGGPGGQGFPGGQGPGGRRSGSGGGLSAGRPD